MSQPDAAQLCAQRCTEMWCREDPCAVVTATTPPPPRDGEVCAALVAELDTFLGQWRTVGAIPFELAGIVDRFRPAAPPQPPAADSPTPGTETCEYVRQYGDGENAPTTDELEWCTPHDRPWWDGHREEDQRQADERCPMCPGNGHSQLSGLMVECWRGCTALSPVDSTEPPADANGCPAEPHHGVDCPGDACRYAQPPAETQQECPTPDMLPLICDRCGFRHLSSPAAIAARAPADTETPRSGRWWRVIAPDGSLWCETSDEEEARTVLRPGDTLYREYVRTAREWRPARAALDAR